MTTSDWQEDSARRAEAARDARVKADRGNLRLWMTPEREESLRSNLAGYLVTDVSVDGLRCADLLEQLFCGLHHFPGGYHKVRKTAWDDFFVKVMLTEEFATYDHDRLTRAVLLGHALGIRVSLSGRGMNRMEMMLHPRVRRGDDGLGIGRSHPSIDEMIATFRKYNPNVER